MKKADDLAGMRFGKLVAISQAPAPGRHAKWHCICDCGGISTPFATNLKAGISTSCGCVRSAKRRELAARAAAERLRFRKRAFNTFARKVGIKSILARHMNREDGW